MLTVMVMDRQPIVRAGVEHTVAHNAQLRKFVQVLPYSLDTFADGAAYCYDSCPDVILLDAELPLSYNQRQSINLGRITEFYAQTGVPILLVCAPTTNIAPALVMLKQGVIAGFIEKTVLHHASQLRTALQHIVDKKTYIYWQRGERKLADFGVQFRPMSDLQIEVLEQLAQTDEVPTIASSLKCSRKSVYNHLAALRNLFGTSDWKDVPVQAEQLGVLHQGRVLCNFGVRRSEKINTIFPNSSDAFSLS